MPNESESNDPGPREQGVRDGRTRDAVARTNADKGTGELTYNADGCPSSRGVCHDSRATSTIGQGNKCLRDTYEQHEEPVPMSE